MFVGYKYWADQNAQFLDTGLTSEENFKLLTKTLKDLGWKYSGSKSGITLNVNDQRYILLWINVLIIPYDHEIGYNFRYHSSKAGRPAVFIGIRTYLKLKFEKSLTKQLYLLHPKETI